MDFLESSRKALNKSAEAINNGWVVIFPTDTVYGFLADAENKKAIEKIYKIKNRPRSKPLPVFIKDIRMAKDLAEISESQEKIINKYWFTRRSSGVGGPGAYTFVLKRKKGLKLYDGGKGTVALRIPNYKPLNDLLKKINKPLAQTSANISGQPSSNNILNIKKVFKSQKMRPDLIISAGNLPKRKSSAIIDLTQDKIKFLRK
jgi:L-threonylcarbamoyladenylate synthase